MSTSMRAVSGVALLLLFGTGGAAAPQSKPRPKPPCCFNHPRYTGSCMVEPGAEETCASILAYLNDPKGAGKTYCSNSVVRGGWKAVRCKPAADRQSD
jgi:hypothetical protein